MYQVTESLVRISGVHQQDMRPLFPVLPHEMVGKEALSAATGAEDKFVTVRYYPFFMGKSDMSRKTGFPVSLSTMRIPKGESEFR